MLHCPECESEEKKRKYDVKQECIDEVMSVEAIKEVERKLWLTHYDKLSEKLTEIVREKCIGCQMNEPNQLGHELCIMSSSEEQGNLCFEEAYKRVIWDACQLDSRDISNFQRDCQFQRIDIQK